MYYLIVLQPELVEPFQEGLWSKVIMKVTLNWTHFSVIPFIIVFTLFFYFQNYSQPKSNKKRFFPNVTLNQKVWKNTFHLMHFQYTLNTFKF